VRVGSIPALIVMMAIGGSIAAVGQSGRQRLNPVIDLIEQKKPVFGLYAPSNRRMPPGPGQVAAAVQLPQKSAAELAKEALANDRMDFVFDGSMEGDFDRGYKSFSEFAAAMGQIGMLNTSPFKRLHHPLIVKAPEIQPDPATVGRQIGQQLNLGVSGVMFVSVESAQEVQQGLSAMRFRLKGGVRDENVGNAPKMWGLSEAEYKAKADLWPLNPDGELINWTIVESKAGLAKLREIAAVKGIGVLWPGAGTLRRVFSTEVDGKRVVDEQAWEAAIQQVLAACKEFKVACGYPATASDIEMRMKQGFSVFVMNWGDAGFKAIDVGRTAAGR
jgi:2-keto-3-deoxy-L-rhamnonate aldolase RhmA